MWTVEGGRFQTPDPLALDGWAEFNRVKWGACPEWVTLAGGPSGLPELRALLYQNRRGRIYAPPLNPYLAVSFTPTPTSLTFRVSRQWLDLGSQLAMEMRSRGLGNMPALPPSVVDARPWQWAGFRPTVRYTLYLDFPIDMSQADKAVRAKIAKAVKQGYIHTRSTDMKAVMECLASTERRQGFSHGLSVADLELARRLLGDEHFRAYVSYAPNGEPACTEVVLHRPGGRALNWVGGGKKEHLSSGTSQALALHALEDVKAAGAIGFDFVGANMSNISSAKADWGGYLAPYYRIEPLGLKSILLWVREWFRTAPNGGEESEP